jgi:hypothetical protein
MLIRMELQTDVITPERLVNALVAAGRRVGIGAWRPECGGRFGRFRVEVLEASPATKAKKSRGG